MALIVLGILTVCIILTCGMARATNKSNIKPHYPITIHVTQPQAPTPSLHNNDLRNQQNTQQEFTNYHQQSNNQNIFDPSNNSNLTQNSSPQPSLNPEFRTNLNLDTKTAI